MIGFDHYVLSQPLHTWINDGMMAIFFFVIGLELKREFMEGELSTMKKAALGGGFREGPGDFRRFRVGFDKPGRR